MARRKSKDNDNALDNDNEDYVGVDDAYKSANHPADLGSLKKKDVVKRQKHLESLTTTSHRGYDTDASEDASSGEEASDEEVSEEASDDQGAGQKAGGGDTPPV